MVALYRHKNMIKRSEMKRTEGKEANVFTGKGSLSKDHFCSQYVRSLIKWDNLQLNVPKETGDREKSL